MKDISAIILTYNRIEYTKDCIDSFIETAPDNYELFIFDNGSTDGTKEYIKELSILNDRIRYHFSETNLYPSGGYKKGLGLVSPAKAYMICDNDGFFDNDKWYDISMKLLEQHRDVGIIGLRRSKWEKHFFNNQKISTIEDIEYIKGTDGIASHTILTEDARKILTKEMNGKWIGTIITKLIRKHGLESIKLKDGLIYDMSELDLDNPKYRDMYLKFWETKGCINEYHRRIKTYK